MRNLLPGRGTPVTAPCGGSDRRARMPRAAGALTVRSLDTEETQMRSTEKTGLETTLAGTGDGAAVMGSDGQITFWNTAAEHISAARAARSSAGPAGRSSSAATITATRCARRCARSCRSRAGACRCTASTCEPAPGPAGRSGCDVSVLSVDGSPGPQVVHLFRDVTVARETTALIGERLALAASTVEAGGVPALSRREVEVLHLLIEGLGNAAIAERLRVRRIRCGFTSGTSSAAWRAQPTASRGLRRASID